VEVEKARADSGGEALRMEHIIDSVGEAYGNEEGTGVVRVPVRQCTPMA